MLYEALSFTQTKVIDPLLIVRPSNLLIWSNIFSKLLETGKNKNLCYTYAFT
jgi:hypothetical protein